jgi:elongation factor Ts
MIKAVREKTNAGIMDCKRALLQADGDIAKASDLLREQGLAKLERKVGRTTTQGLIETYIHPGGRLGVVVEVNCETDFVAHTDEFKQLAHDVALQVAATAPQFISPEEIPQGANLDPEEVCLLAQPFIKDEARTIHEIIAEMAAKVGEKISIRRFARFELGR